MSLTISSLTADALLAFEVRRVPKLGSASDERRRMSDAAQEGEVRLEFSERAV